MNNTSHYISKNFSAPVVQSRLKHHHELLSKPEVRTQHQHQHQKSKPLSNNKGKKSPHQQKLKETTTFTSPPSPFTASTSFSDNTNRRNFNNFDSSYHREQSVGYNNNNLVENGSQLQRKTSTSNRPLRRHQYSGSVDEGKSAPSVLILKRPQSATDFVRSNNNAKSSDVTHEEHQNNHRLRSNNNNNNKFGEKSPQRSERRRSDVTHSRSKRPQRKEVKSMELDTDLVLNNIQQLSNESDVNSNNKYAKSVSSSSHNININNNNNNNTTTTTTSQTINAVMFPPLNYSNAIIALEEEMNSNKKEDKEDTYSISDDNITFKSSLNKKRSDNYAETTPRRLSSTAIELQNQVSRFADFDSDSDSLSSARRGLNSSPGRLGGAPKLYAGPTFHNSPAPSDLPMPSFYGKSLGKDQSPLSTNLFTVPENPPSLIPSYDNYSSPSSGNTSDDDIFAMDDVETPASRKQKSRELLRILAGPNIRQNHTAAAYMVPERMATAHNPTKVYPTNDLNEISENLRSLLKIHGQ